ncbi:MAG: flavodoxin-dependent (E)-4-hydroxy-3-methylbut-2-enyl-diphosphate synthase [Spirochaetales bacterium]|nr:MAG: flavodoxin-dependent (E)-4-hydroxy-3-methylbut-2-enyl-diphosphate synthase [Spirochaetales bacterium]
MGKNTRTVKVGSVIVGGGHPLAVQTMWKEPLRADGLDAAVSRIDTLAALGCGILRFAVPDLDAADVLGRLTGMTAMPLVADIHFDWRIALRCLDYPIAKIRVNPGNLGAAWKLEEVAAKAAGKGIPIRIGVNAGSLPPDLKDRSDRAEALVSAAEREVEALEARGFRDVIVSMKASSVIETISANEQFASRHDIPLHIGVTEAGPLVQGCVRSAIALYALLSGGVGDTLRVSLSDDMESEILAAREILAQATGTRTGADIVSCPRCGRAGFDTHSFTARWRDRIYGLKKPVTIAIMGCVVNGPGEAKHADLGITGAGDKVIVFSKGKIVRTCDASSADIVFGEELSRL